MMGMAGKRKLGNSVLSAQLDDDDDDNDGVLLKIKYTGNNAFCF